MFYLSVLGDPVEEIPQGNGVRVSGHTKAHKDWNENELFTAPSIKTAGKARIPAVR